MTTTINNEHKKLNVPNLRFPEFTGEWKKCTLGEIGNGFDYGMNAAAKPFDGNNKYIRITDIDEASATYIDSDIVSPDGVLQDSYLVKPNDILLARTGASTGKSYLYNTKDGKLYFAGFLIRVNIPANDSYFVFTQLHTSRYKKWIGIMSARSGQPGVNSQEYSTFPIHLPSLEEQGKISKLLQAIDKRIATQIKIIEDLKKLKSAITQRLLNDRELLETRISLGSICELKNGYAFKSSSYSTNGKYKIITIANVQGDRYIIPEDCKTISYLPEDVQEHQILKENDILISMTGNVGRVSLCKKGYYLLNQRVGLLVPQINDIEYLFQVLSSDYFEKSMIACGQGAAQMNIGKSDIDGYLLPFSRNSNNTNLIAKVLQNFDKSIEINVGMLNRLNLQKRYLLSQMFI